MSSSGESETPRDSCNPRLTRKEFLAKVMKNAALAGTIAAVPAIADAFLAPPASAQASTNVCCQGESVTDCGQDTDVCADTGCNNVGECV